MTGKFRGLAQFWGLHFHDLIGKIGMETRKTQSGYVERNYLRERRNRR
jgi:hypothetical protein